MATARESSQKPPPHTSHSSLDRNRPSPAISTFTSPFTAQLPPSPSPSPTSPSINSTPLPGPSTPSSSTPPYHSASTSSPPIFSSLTASPLASSATSPRSHLPPPRRNSLDDFVHVDSPLPSSSSAPPPGGHSLSVGESPVRKWSFSSLLSAVQQATPTLPRVNVRRNLNVMSQWFSAQGRGRDEREEEEEENGFTAQEGMEEQIDPNLLTTDGHYDVNHLDFTRSVTPRYQGGGLCSVVWG